MTNTLTQPCLSEDPLTCEQYDRIGIWCHQQINQAADLLFDGTLFVKEIHQASKQFGVHHQSLHSLFCNIHMKHVKQTAPKIKRGIASHDASTSSNICGDRASTDYASIQSNSNISITNASSPNNNAFRPRQNQQGHGNISGKYNGIIFEYQNGTSILEISKRVNFPPYLLSRYIVEHITTLNVGKKGVTAAMRDPVGVLGDANVLLEPYKKSEEKGDHSTDKSTHQHPSSRLAAEVQASIGADPIYGPIHDRQRQMVGIEFEVVLEQTLLEMDLAFESETELRERGASRTPDVLLRVPIAIPTGASTVPPSTGDNEASDANTGKAINKESWRLINWIDSKALFGDVETHVSSVLPQAESYVNRFGPGLVLYWFGHAPIERLQTSKDIVVLGWDMPAQFLWPTGEIGRRKTAMVVASEMLSNLVGIPNDVSG